MLSRFCRLLTACLIAAGTPACLNTSQQQIEQPYFDIQGYFASQINRLDSLQPTILKTAHLNGEKDIDTLKEVRWQNELKSFKELNLNKAAWLDSYSIDTLTDSVKVIHYQSQRDDLPVRYVKIAFNQDKTVRWLKAKRINDNFIYRSVHIYNYHPGHYYSVNASQDILLLDSNSYQIQARFLHDF
jgi:hypothetical protein